jgi:AbrB family looped-hinge helix DNA binding protein
MHPRHTSDRRLRSMLSRKGQVTIPVAVRRRLKLERGDDVAFVVEERQVRLEKAPSLVDQLFGSLATNKPPLTAEELREVAEDAIAREGVNRAPA